MSNDSNNQLTEILGKTIKDASSSLNCFTLEFSDGTGLVASAGGEEPTVGVSLTKSDSLPKPADAVCAVDWSWILGTVVKQVKLDGKRLSLQLDPSGPLSVSAGIWQGSPFLMFQPYRPPS